MNIEILTILLAFMTLTLGLGVPTLYASISGKRWDNLVKESINSQKEFNEKWNEQRKEFHTEMAEIKKEFHTEMTEIKKESAHNWEVLHKEWIAQQKEFHTEMTEIKKEFHTEMTEIKKEFNENVNKREREVFEIIKSLRKE